HLRRHGQLPVQVRANGRGGGHPPLAVAAPPAMKLSEYIEQDGLALAALVRSGEVTSDELADCARRMIEAVNPRINALVEQFPEPLAGSSDPAAPFSGVPFLVKD